MAAGAAEEAGRTSQSSHLAVLATLPSYIASQADNKRMPPFGLG
jgi:hypothetical protein